MATGRHINKEGAQSSPYHCFYCSTVKAANKTRQPGFFSTSVHIQIHLAHEHLVLIEATSAVLNSSVAREFWTAFIHKVEQLDKCSKFEGIPPCNRGDLDEILEGKELLLPLAS